MQNDITKNYHRGNLESADAYKKIRHTAASYRESIYKYIKLGGGLTCEEIEIMTGWKHQTVSARISELKRDGRIISIGKRETKSGCKAAVYVSRSGQLNLFRGKK
jgi:Fic family protein